MANYWIKTPGWLKKFFPKELIWKMPPGDHPAIYLTFDDGPHPEATKFVLDQLDKYNAKASFFCIGKNVVENPEVYSDLVEKGHTVGNHTHNHLNGWKWDNRYYLRNVVFATQHIASRSFRPPYGRIKISQARKLLHSKPAWKIYMWDVLSGDFDTHLTPAQCLENVIANVEPGSIVVFHDSTKAWERMSYALPRVLEYCRQQNWAVKALPKH